MKKKLYDGLLRRRMEVSVDAGGACYRNAGGDRLFRIETKGSTGRTLYRNGWYITPIGTEMAAHGMSGSTGRGWGGSIQGYLTEAEIDQSNLKIQ